MLWTISSAFLRSPFLSISYNLTLDSTPTDLPGLTLFHLDMLTNAGREATEISIEGMRDDGGL